MSDQVSWACVGAMWVFGFVFFVVAAEVTDSLVPAFWAAFVCVLALFMTTNTD